MKNAQSMKMKTHRVGIKLLQHTPPKLFHPVFDLQGNLLTYGFRVEQPDPKKTTRTKPKAIHIVSVAGDVYSFTGMVGEADHRVLRHRDVEAAVLPALYTQWARADVRAFLDDPKCLSDRELYEHLTAAWQRYVDFDNQGMYVISACWGVMTYVYPIFAAVPFLHFLGEKGTGKSQALDVFQQLSRQGYKSQATAAVVGDLIQSRRVTLLFDQADNMKPFHVDLFTDSYRRGSRRTIVDMDKRNSPQEFETFGPKAFAGTKSLHNDLADRVILVATSPTSQVMPPVMPDDLELRRLRAECHRWSLLNFPKVRAVAPLTDPEWSGLTPYTGRQRELWLPIECMMEALDVPEGDRRAARDYYQRSQTSTKAELSDDTVELLQVLVKFVGDSDECAVTSTQLLAKLPTGEGLDPSQEIDLSNPDVAEWTPRKLGTQLNNLGVIRSKKRTESNTVRRYAIDCHAVRTKARRYGLTE